MTNIISTLRKSFWAPQETLYKLANSHSYAGESFEKWSFRYNCYETVHPYTPYCSHSSLEIGIVVFAEAIKLYTPLYLVSATT